LSSDRLASARSSSSCSLPSPEAATGRARGPVSYDLIVPSDNFVVRFARLELIGEMDHDQIDGFDNLRPDMREAGSDPGNKYSVPWATGTTGIGYDTTVFPEPPGYDVFLDEDQAGRTTILNEMRDAFGLAPFSLDLDPNTTAPDDISAAADRLIEMKGVIRAFDSDTYLEDLANGDLAAAHAYSSDVLQARQQNPNLAFSLPAQGALKWVDSLAIPADAGRSENAHRFISFYLQPKVSARVAEAIQADTGNAAALDLGSESLRSNPVIFRTRRHSSAWCLPRTWARTSRTSTPMPGSAFKTPDSCRMCPETRSM
jgi:putrescine transport system substrate-binding protein